MVLPQQFPKVDDLVEVIGGKHNGTWGRVKKVSRQDANRPYWQILTESGHLKWVDAVQCVDNTQPKGQGKGSPPGPPPARPVGNRLGPSFRPNMTSLAEAVKTGVRSSKTESAPEQEDFAKVGDVVEITGGAKSKSRGQVMKVTGASKADRRWQIKAETGGLTWSDSVRRLSATESALSREEWETRRVESEKEKTPRNFAWNRSADINAVDWCKAQHLKSVSGGCGGVLLIDFGDECLALKYLGKTLQEEVVAEHVVKACGVRVASSRIINTSHPDHKIITEKLSRCRIDNEESPLLQYRFLGTNIREGNLVYGGNGYGVEMFYILEFVPGHPLCGVEACTALARFGCLLLRDLGRLCAVDVLLNNFDRMPLPIWQNDGNLGNVMVSEEGSRIVGIDQQVFCISKGPARDSYLEKVKALIHGFGPGGDCRSTVTCVKKALVTNCAADINQEEIESFLAGFREGLQAISNAQKDRQLAKSLERATRTCAEKLSEPETGPNWHRVFFDPMALADIVEFVELVAETISLAVSLWNFP